MALSTVLLSPALNSGSPTSSAVTDLAEKGSMGYLPCRGTVPLAPLAPACGWQTPGP